MAEIVNITPLDPVTFEFQEYSPEDSSLITSLEIQTSFNPNTDRVEFFIYDLNNSILYQNVSGYGGYRLIDNNLVLDPQANLASLGYTEGQYNTLYNFVSPKLSSDNTFNYFISQISPDRTEIRLDTTKIPNEFVISSSQELISNIQNTTGSYYDFYLDFGSNDLIIANNALLDTSSLSNPTVLIKLYEPLPEQFTLNSLCWVVTKVANSVAYNVELTQTFDVLDQNIQLRGPNTNLSIQDQINNSTEYNTLSTLSSTISTPGSGSLRYQLNNLLAQTGVDINVDYSDYANFIHFSSAQTRLENFYYKLSLIETYQASASIASVAPTNYYVSSSQVIWQSKINEIITGFDGYEYYLYYTSGSSAWPKTGNTPPYTNVTTTSTAGINWFTTQSLIAEEYDLENNNALINAIPAYLIEDPNNAQFELFVEMIGQYFDTIFLYTQDVTNKYNADNRVNYGVSKDLVSDILRDMGIKIYQNNFSTNDLYSALLGLTPSGSLYNLPYTTGSLPTPTGYEYINTYVTASATGSLIPTEDINAEIYKRIYSNLPYLLKKKGTREGLKALITLYGIPDTILQVNEFGGQDQIDENDYDLWFDQYNYAFDTKGTNFISSSFQLNTAWNAIDNVPYTMEMRFKTPGLPTNTGYYSQSLWSFDDGGGTGGALILRYTGSAYTSGSYSGSIPNPYNEFALLEFIPDKSTPSTSASIYLPFFDGGWWSVMVNRDNGGASTTYTVTAGNKNYKGGDGNYVSFRSSASVVSSDGVWNQGQISYWATSSLSAKIFSGSLQELRYYVPQLSQSEFADYIMNPYSIDSNGTNTAPTELAFRATLGGELYTASLSVHPKITGSWLVTQSFADNTSTFAFKSDATFVNNTETIYPNQFPAGIKNRVSNKIRQQNEVLPYSGSEEVNLPTNQVLSPFISIQQNVPESGSYTPNIDYVEVAFSPQNEINNDIAGQLGYFNIGEYIGDPRLVSSSAESYPALDAIRDYYFEKYTANYNIWDYIRLIKYFDNSLFKMIQDWIPARTDAATGIVIKQTVLERNKYPVPQPNITSSIAYYGSGSGANSAWDIPFQVENLAVTGTIDIGSVTGSTGEVLPDLIAGYTLKPVTASNGQRYLAEYGTPLNPMLNLTQSWLGSTPSLSGSVGFTQSTAIEFFNGELSGSAITVESGSLNGSNPYLKASTQLYPFAGTASTDFDTNLALWLTSSNYIPAAGQMNVYIYILGLGGGYVDGIGYFKINRTDGSGNDISDVLQGIDTIYQQIPTNTSYVKETILSIQEYATYYLYTIKRNGNSNYFSGGDTPFSSRAFIFSPIGGGIIYENSDYNSVINNVVESRPNDKLFDVDFSSNAITAVNAVNIISSSRGSGSATPATVPASNYTTLRVANPRYNGCENTSPNFNVGTGSQLPVIERYGKFALIYNGAGKNDNLYPNNTTYFNINTMVDDEGNVYQPKSGSVYEWNALDAFGKDEIITMVIQNTSSVTPNTINALQGEQTVYSLFETLNSPLTTVSASGFLEWNFPALITASIYLVDELNQVGALSSAPYWSTSSGNPSIITSSLSGTNLGYYLKQNDLGSNWSQQQGPGIRSGLNAPLSLINPKPGDKFYIADNQYEYTVISSSYDASDYFIYLDKPVVAGYESLINGFLFVRSYSNLNKITLNVNLSGSNPTVGTGYIFTQKSTPQFQNNLGSITTDLALKNLI